MSNKRPDTSSERIGSCGQDYPITMGYFLRGLFLDGDSQYSEGNYDFTRWAVRLGLDPHSDDARAASLHESYHSSLNDSTAYGTLLHVAHSLAMGRPEYGLYEALFLPALTSSVRCHEMYATYASLFIVGKGAPQESLLAIYGDDYKEVYAQAQVLAHVFPNDLLGFHLVQALCRCCMQASCLDQLQHTIPADWRFDTLLHTDIPDNRLTMLLSGEGLAADAYSSLLEWGRSAGSQVDALFQLRRGDRSSYEQIIREEYDDAADAVGLFFYDFIASRLRSTGASCLTFNGHQVWVPGLLKAIERVLPNEAPVRPLHAAPHGNVTQDFLIQSFADERLVVSPSAYEARLYDIADLADADLQRLLTGPDPHGMVAVRPAWRLLQMYRFPNSHADSLRGTGRAPLVCLRRRAVEQESGEPLIEHFLIRSPADLVRLRSLTSQGAFFVGSASLTCLADRGWQQEWLPTFRSFVSLSALIDLNPFIQVRNWASQNEYEIHYSSINVHGDDKEQLVYALYPATGDDIIYLAPCSGILANALTHCIRGLPDGAQLREDSGFIRDRARIINYTISHLFREEPWFDFLLA